MRSIVDEPRKSESRGSRTQLFPGPKTPFLAEIAPERQLFEFTVALENTPGVIEAVAAVLCKHNVNVLSATELLDTYGPTQFGSDCD